MKKIEVFSLVNFALLWFFVLYLYMSGYNIQCDVEEITMLTKKTASVVLDAVDYLTRIR